MVPAGAIGSQRAPSYHCTAPAPLNSTWNTTPCVPAVVVPSTSAMKPLGTVAGSTANVRSMPRAAGREQATAGSDVAESSASSRDCLPRYAVSALTAVAARLLGVLHPTGTLPTWSGSKFQYCVPARAAAGPPVSSPTLATAHPTTSADFQRRVAMAILRVIGELRPNDMERPFTFHVKPLGESGVAFETPTIWARSLASGACGC